jgi:hypothetical protein
MFDFAVREANSRRSARHLLHRLDSTVIRTPQIAFDASTAPRASTTGIRRTTSRKNR